MKEYDRGALVAHPRPSAFPLARFHLRRNPFGKVPMRDWSSLLVADLHPWIEHLRGERVALQLMGRHGRGKSTHLRALHRAFSNAPLYQLAEGERLWIPRAPCLFIDESQRLPWWQREFLWRGCRSLVVATHRSHIRQLRRLGFDVIAHEVSGLSLAKLRDIVQRRLVWAHDGCGPLPTISDDELQQLIEYYGDDLRAIERKLYKSFQSQSLLSQWTHGEVHLSLEQRE